MTTAKDLVDAIQSGKSATIQATFNSLMTEKIQDGIEAYRQAVIDNTFNPELASESLDEELQLEDYSLDEIQEFMMSEEYETLDELSKKTLGAYVNKATSGLKGAASQGFMAGANQGKNDKVSDKAYDTAVKRIRGIKNAVSRLTKESEEVESVDELSKKTLKSYYKKASADRSKAQTTAQKYSDKATTAGIKTSTNTQKYKDLKSKADAAGDKMVKRTNGTDAAGKRLGYFESEEVDELSKKTLGDYVNKATSGLKGSASQGFMAGANQGKNDKVSDKAYDTAVKRIRGIKNAVSRLTKESEEVDELSKKTSSLRINQNGQKST